MKRIALVWLVLSAGSLWAQTSAITATITDPDAQTWNNGTYTITFVPAPNQPGPSTWSGGTLVLQYQGTLSASGVLTVSVADNNFVSPPGSKWQFTLCPNSSAPCENVVSAVTGASPNLSTALSNGLTAPRFNTGQFAYGYLDAEVNTPVVTGSTYFNVTSLIQRIWTGSAWANNTGGGGGTIGGSGTPGTLPIWVTNSTTLGNSNESEATGVFTIASPNGMATTAAGGGVFSAPVFASTSVTVPVGSDYSLFLGSDDIYRCQLSVALGSGSCINFSVIAGQASASQIGDLSATYVLQSQLNNAAQYATTYYSAAGSSNVLSGISPPATNGIWYEGYSITASTAVPPSKFQFGMSGRSITGSATTDTVLYSDVGTTISHDVAGSQSVTETLPTATALVNPNMVFSYANHSTHVDTITPTTWTIQAGTTAAGATLSVAAGSTCRITVDANSATNWHADCFAPPGGGGTVTSIATTSPITGGTITTTGTIACATCGVTGSPLSQFAATTSAQLAGVLSDETGTGVAVFSTSPALVTPALGVATATSLGVGTSPPNCTAGSSGALCQTEGTAPTGLSSTGELWPDSGSHVYFWNSNNATTQHLPQTAFITADYTNATTTFSSLTNLAFAVNASTNYHMHCNLVWSASAATAGPKYQITGPASPTAVVIQMASAVTSSTTASAGVTAFSSSLSPTGAVVTTATTEYSTLDMDLRNGSNAGTVQVQAAAQGTGTLTISNASGCQLQ